jgi:hypothetical protein
MATAVPRLLSAARHIPARHFSTIVTCEFVDSASKRFGKEHAKDATLFCHKNGIAPEKLSFIGRGNNTIAFSYKNSLVFKICNDIENIKGILPRSRLSAPCLGGATLGYDMGGAPIRITIEPFFDTVRTTPEDVKTLCQTLLSEGIVLYDNKLENIGISEEGIPVVIDPGALETSPKGHPLHFIYPELTGYDPDKQGFIEPVPVIAPEVRATELVNTQKAKLLLDQCRREKDHLHSEVIAERA